MEKFISNILESDSPFAALYQFLVLALASMIPFTPIPVIAIYIASNHNFINGLFINLLGTLMGSSLLYFLSKTWLRSFSLNYLTKYKSLTKYMQLIQTNGFLAVLIGRLFPFIPSAGLNIIAGLSNVSFIAFLAASFLGKLPSFLAFSLAGHQIAAGNWGFVLIIFLYLLVLVLIGKKIKEKWAK